MTEENLTRFIKAGYLHVKEAAGLPSWVLPEYGFNRTADQIGDSGALKVSQPLGLSEAARQVIGSGTDITAVTAQDWREAIAKWEPLSQLRPIIDAFLRTVDPVTAQLPSIRPSLDPMVVCRSMAVLLYAPFAEGGKALLDEIAGVLDCPASDAAALAASYGDTVRNGDIATLEKVSRCILRHSSWQEWAAALEEEALKCSHTPRLIAVTPPLSADLVGILASLIKEAFDEPSRDNSEHPDEPIAAQRR